MSRFSCASAPGLSTRRSERTVIGLIGSRRRHWRFTDIGLSPGQTHQLAGVYGACLEIEAVIYPGSATECRLALLCGDDDENGATIVYDTTRGTISLNGASEALVLADGELLKLRVFVDRPLVEVFANRRICLSAWPHPRLKESGFVRLSAVGGSAVVKWVDVWQMRVIKE